MATKKKEKEGIQQLQRAPVELLYRDELQRLITLDTNAKYPKPPGWQLSMTAVRKFILGDEALGITSKFVGNPSLVDRAMVTLATNRGLMLIGEPGTAKSLLSELLASAVSGTSTLTIQGGASLTEDQIKYSWNYALLVAEGPSLRSLVPAPLYRGMQLGKIVRFEEITRCPVEVQDALLSMLSDRVLAVPELGDDQNAMLYAKEGFNIIGTANTRDKGVNEMSSALKRRFNFETVFPIPNYDMEFDLVKKESSRLLEQSGVPIRPNDELLHVLITTFRELRLGETIDGHGLEPISSVLSTAEAVAVAHAACLRGYFLRGDGGNAQDVVEQLSGTIVKDNKEDLKRLRAYIEQRVVKRNEPMWRAFYEARHFL